MTAWVLLMGLALLLAMNLPIALAIGLSSAAAILCQGDMSLMVLAQRMYAGADSFHLLAVPLFMFSGVLMEAGGISRRIVDLAGALVGWLPGGLAAVTVAAAMFFAGISGSAAADAAAVGGILIPAMKRAGYDSGFAAAVQAAGGSVGVIIPPSIPMIIFGYLTGASIGKLFAGGIIPGLLVGLSLMAVASLVSLKKGYSPTSPFEAARVWRALKRALWALGALAIILGGILGGVFTATESAAVALVYSLVVGMFVYRRLRPKDLPRLFVSGAITSAVVMFIIAAASVFSWVAAMEDLPGRLAGALLGLSSDPVVLLLLLNLVLLLAGTFVETSAALILLTPLMVAMLPSLGISLVQLGVIVVANLAIGMLTPPMGICLIVSGSISGDSLGLVSRRVLPFLGVLLLDLMLITFVPPLTMWLAGMVGK